MPVRIYDLAKKLGLESKEVLARAKELGITSAKVPSSSLDKITAEYLESQFTPRVAAKVPESPVVSPPATPSEPMVTAVAPPEVSKPSPIAPAIEHFSPVVELPPPAPTPEVLPPVAEMPSLAPSFEGAPAAPEAAPIEMPSAPVAEVTPPTHVPVEAKAPPSIPAPAPVAPPQPVAPTPPPGPQVGEKIGFIQLPQKPAPRTQERPPPQRTGPPQRPQVPQRPQIPQRQDQFRGRQDFQRGPQQQFRGPQQGGYQQRGGGMRPGQGQQGRDQARPPAVDKFIPPTTGEMITMKPPIIVRELAERVQKKPFELIAALMKEGVFATVNQAIDEVVAQKVCARYGFRFEVEKVGSPGTELEFAL